MADVFVQAGHDQAVIILYPQVDREELSQRPYRGKPDDHPCEDQTRAQVKGIIRADQ